MSALNGRVDIIVQNGKVALETSMDPALVCQVLIRALGKVYETRILGLGEKNEVWTPDGFMK
jgi:hypothetical protein